MSDPLLTPADLGTFLGDDSINVDRAAMVIAQAQSACEGVINPIPDGKLYVLFRIVIRTYIATNNQARNYQLAQSDSDYGSSSPVTGVQLSPIDREELLSDLEQTSPAAEAFTIQLNPYPAADGYGYGYCSPFSYGGYW